MDEAHQRAEHALDVDLQRLALGIRTGRRRLARVVALAAGVDPVAPVGAGSEDAEPTVRVRGRREVPQLGVLGVERALGGDARGVGVLGQHPQPGPRQRCAGEEQLAAELLPETELQRDDAQAGLDRARGRCMTVAGRRDARSSCSEAESRPCRNSRSVRWTIRSG